MKPGLCQLFALFCIAFCCHALELSYEHSFDGGRTFTKAGVIEGNYKVRTSHKHARPHACLHARTHTHSTCT